MSAALQPFGLKPVYHSSGLDRAIAYTGGLSSSATLYQFSPVSINAGLLTNDQATGAAAGTTFGVFDGIEYTDASGRRAVSKWYSSALGTITDQLVWVWIDPETVYEVQGNGPINAAAIGREFDYVNPAAGSIIGNGGLGQSTAALDSTGPVAAGTQGKVVVVGLGRAVGNSWGDAYTVVQVKLAEQRTTAPVPSANA